MLVSPFDNLRSLGRKHYPFIPVSLLLKHPFDSPARAPTIETPLLMLAGDRDWIIPSTFSRRLYDAWAGPKQWTVLPGMGHNDIHAHPGYWPAIRECLGSLDRAC